jgi:hypothetical protein
MLTGMAIDYLERMEHGAWRKNMRHRVGKQKSKFRRKPIKIEFLPTTGYWIH